MKKIYCEHYGGYTENYIPIECHKLAKHFFMFSLGNHTEISCYCGVHKPHIKAQPASQIWKRITRKEYIIAKIMLS